MKLRNFKFSRWVRGVLVFKQEPTLFVVVRTVYKLFIKVSQVFCVSDRNKTLEWDLLKEHSAYSKLVSIPWTLSMLIESYLLHPLPLVRLCLSLIQVTTEPVYAKITQVKIYNEKIILLQRVNFVFKYIVFKYCI